MARNKKPKTAKEIRKQKRECERKRRARIKANPDLYEASKRKDNLRYAEKRRKKQVKLVSEMTPRERRANQREWRERKARSRQNKKRNERLLQSLRENTPESIAGDQNVASPDSQKNVSYLSPASSPASSVSRRSLVNLGSSFSREECLTTSSYSSNLNRQKVAGIRLARKRREESRETEQEDKELDNQTEEQEDNELDSETEEREDKELDSEIEELQDKELDYQTEEQEDNELDSETEEQKDKERDSKSEKSRIRIFDSESDDDFEIF